MPTADGQLTAAEIAQLYALVQVQARIRQDLTRLAVQGALVPFQLLRAWYDPTEVLTTVLEVLRVTQAAQRRMAQVTDAYLARSLTVMTGQPHLPVGEVDVATLRRQLTPRLALLVQRDPVPLEPEGDLDLSRVFEDEDESERGRGEDDRDAERDSDRGATDRGADEDLLEDLDDEWDDGQVRPVEPSDVYERVAAEYRWQVSQGRAEDAARRAALERATSIVQTDVALAQRAQENRVLRLQDPTQIVGYRRILHPELSETGPCGLCIVAADRKYHIKNLKPIHGRCVCTVMPITRRADPGLKLNQDDLDRLYAAAGGTTAGRALKRVRAVITEHGELGPILAEAPKTKRGLRGPVRVAIDQARGRRQFDPAVRIAALEHSISHMQRQVRQGNRRVAGTIRHQQQLLERLRAELAGVS